MSEDKCYASDPCHSRFLTWVNVKHGGAELGDVVVAQDFDAERALRLEAERQAEELRRLLETMTADRDAEKDMKALARTQRDLQCELAMNRLAKLDTATEQLDTAMGLLRELRRTNCWTAEMEEFLNTASTEGKDHE